MEKKTIYNLKLHEVMQITTKDEDSRSITTYLVTRVPGGWIYTMHYNPDSTMFIPWNNDLLPKD